MRQGSQLHPQAFGDYVVDDCCTCAIGAIYEALMGKLPPAEKDKAYACWLVGQEIRLATGIHFNTDLLEHPVLHETWGLSAIIASLNDNYKWTREQIADWLEGLGY